MHALGARPAPGCSYDLTDTVARAMPRSPFILSDKVFWGATVCT